MKKAKAILILTTGLTMSVFIIAHFQLWHLSKGQRKDIEKEEKHTEEKLDAGAKKDAGETRRAMEDP